MREDHGTDARKVAISLPVAPYRTRCIPTEVALGPPEGLPKACEVNLDTITTIPRQTLTMAIGPLPAEKLAAVERSLMFALGLVSRPR